MLHTITRRTILQKVPHRPAGLCVLVNTRFQVLFHSPPGVLFTFPSQYCSAIGHQVVFRLGGWSPRLLIGFHVSGDTLELLRSLSVRLRGCHPLWLAFPYHSAPVQDPLSQPDPASKLAVWPLPRSLATTCGISVDFFSSGYLDVSVPRVPHINLWIQFMFHISSI